MKTIWKFPLKVAQQQTIDMPPGVVLSVAAQNDVPCLWALVNPRETPSPLDVFTFLTGVYDVDTEGLRFVGTYFLAGGAFVGHVFVRG